MRIVLRIFFGVVGLLAAMFIPAGRWDLPLFWAFFGLLLVSLAVAVRVMDPGLVKERMRPGAGGTDRALRLLMMPFFLGHLIVAGLDVGRYHWSAPMPTWLSVLGLLLLAASMSLSTWAVHTNRFFSPVVRIQEERGHHVITGGPYRYVRHPGYTAAMGSIVASGLALGSWWSYAPLVPIVVMIVRRTIIEDRFLHEHLEGYAGFARQTRYRWIPGVW